MIFYSENKVIFKSNIWMLNLHCNVDVITYSNWKMILKRGNFLSKKWVSYFIMREKFVDFDQWCAVLSIYLFFQSISKKISPKMKWFDGYQIILGQIQNKCLFWALLLCISTSFCKTFFCIFIKFDFHVFFLVFELSNRFRLL